MRADITLFSLWAGSSSITLLTLRAFWAGGPGAAVLAGVSLCALLTLDFRPGVGADQSTVRFGEIGVSADVCAGGLALVGRKGRAAVIAVFQVQIRRFSVRAGLAGCAVGAVLDGLRMCPVFVGDGDGGGIAGLGKAHRGGHAVLAVRSILARIALCAGVSLGSRVSFFSLGALLTLRPCCAGIAFHSLRPLLSGVAFLAGNALYALLTLFTQQTDGCAPCASRGRCRYLLRHPNNGGGQIRMPAVQSTVSCGRGRGSRAVMVGDPHRQAVGSVGAVFSVLAVRPGRASRAGGKFDVLDFLVEVGTDLPRAFLGLPHCIDL